MLIALTTHPIQMQVPLWRALHDDGRVPFEVWYMTDHAARPGPDVEFGKHFAWDVDMLSGYRYRILEAAADAHPASFWKCRLREDLGKRLDSRGATVLWIQGWQVAGYWQAAMAARKSGVRLWIRGESNDLSRTALWKRWMKRLLLGWLFEPVDCFFYIGSANRRFYESYGVSGERLLPAPYCVDTERFRLQAEQARNRRAEIRSRWGIPADAFCVLFCAKFISKKRPLDLVLAAQELVTSRQLSNVHLLFVGAGELGRELRRRCRVVHDAEAPAREGDGSAAAGAGPGAVPASFTGFLNQTEVSDAYVAADCLVLPSDYGETWGLVVNEAMISGLPCIISDHCGSAEDLGTRAPNRVFPFGQIEALAGALTEVARQERPAAFDPRWLRGHSLDVNVSSVAQAWAASCACSPGCTQECF